MRPLRRTIPAAAAAAAIAIFGVGCSNAKATTWAPTVGIGDNNPPMFTDPNYTALGTKISRKIVAYDWYHHADARAAFKQWMDAAEAAGVRPLIAFNHSDRSARKLPTVATFQKSLRYLLKNYPQVKDFSPWNEANHRSQPTAYNPKRAAQYYNAARKICHGCNIVAADVLDQKNMLPWIATFRKTAYKPHLWGLHSYVDVNHNVPWSRSAAKKLIAAVPGTVWLTEVGGLVAFSNTFSYNESRASTGTKNTLKLAGKSRRIRRVYLYDWFGVNQRHRKPYIWDSGLVSAEGKPRPAYYALRSWLKSHTSALRIK